MSNKNDDDKHIVRGGGPCGACRYLRRKCVKTCIFAPYFESDPLGTSHFAALHKVFGASNASKLLLTIPSDKRPDAVVSLCYEALSRVSDPVYGCVSHILILQQQVENLQAELSYVQAQLSILQCSPFPTPPLHLVDHQSSREDIKKLRQLDDPSELDQTSSFQLSSINNSREDNDAHNDDLQRFARELVDNYFPGIKFHSTS